MSGKLKFFHYYHKDSIMIRIGRQYFIIFVLA